jgi:hypothetical protein
MKEDVQPGRKCHGPFAPNLQLTNSYHFYSFYLFFMGISQTDSLAVDLEGY